jgi:hypothetical protein
MEKQNLGFTLGFVLPGAVSTAPASRLNSPTNKSISL